MKGNEDGLVLYIYPDVGSKAMRGSVQKDGKTWVCAEHWTASDHNGYITEPDIDTSNGVLTRIK